MAHNANPQLAPSVTLEEECARSAPSSVRLENSGPVAQTIAGAAIVEEADVLRGSLKVGSVAQVVVATIATVGLLYLLKFVMITVLVALLLAFILDPFVQLQSRIAIPKAVGALVAVVLAAVLVAGVGYFLYARLGDFAAELPKYSERIKRVIRPIQEPLNKLERGAGSIDTAPTAGREPVPVTVREAPIFSRVIAANGGAIGQVLLGVGFVPFLAYFMLTWKEHAHSATVRLFPEEHRTAAYRTVAKISAMIRTFIVGNLTIGVISATISVAVFWFLHIPYFYFLGIISGFVNLIPSLGVFLALVPPLAGGIGIVDKTGIVIILLTIAGTHAATMNILYPKFIGQKARLNPLAVLLALLFWVWIWGAAGLILAVPIVGALKIVCDHTDSLKGIGDWLGD
jgi:predicted PurR-regulated permease PerM